MVENGFNKVVTVRVKVCAEHPEEQIFLKHIDAISTGLVPEVVVYVQVGVVVEEVHVTDAEDGSYTVALGKIMVI